MTGTEKEDLINSVFRGTTLSNKGYDPGDIVGPQSGDLGTVVTVVAFVIWLIYNVKNV